MFCPKCGQQNESVAQFCQACGNDLSGTRQLGTTGGAQPTLHVYAGFWQRVAAVIIDTIVLTMATSILTAATVGVAWFSIFLLPWVYEAVMLSSEKQATLGKMILGIAVVDLNGNRLTFGRATGRHFAKWVSAILLGIGFLMAAFTERKQALHDMMADTLVITRQP